MNHYARLRPRLSRLTFPLIWLALISGVTSFFSVYELADWLRYTIWASGAVTALVLWLIPSLKFSATFVDVKSSGLFVSRGFGSSRRREIAWTEIAAINHSTMRGIVITTKDDSELFLRGYANQKAIVAELVALLHGKIGS
ncbi:MAG: hypothetical protein RLZZ380_485 [Actinomycetota bacterium]